MLVADPRGGYARRIFMERVPIPDGRHLEKFQKGKRDAESQSNHHIEELNLGSVHVRIDVNEE